MQIFNPAGKAEGFTLIEVLVTFLILAIAATSFLSNLMYSSTLVRSTSLSTIALTAAEAKLEEAIHSSATDIMSYNGQYFDVAGLTVPYTQPNPGFVTVNQIAQVGNSFLYEVNITVSWDNKGRVMNKTLRTVVRK